MIYFSPPCTLGTCILHVSHLTGPDFEWSSVNKCSPSPSADMWNTHACVSVAYIHHATWLSAGFLQTTIVSLTYEQPCHPLPTDDSSLVVMVWYSDAFRPCFWSRLNGVKRVSIYFLIRVKWCTLTMSFCGWHVVETDVKHLLALPSLCCCGVSATLSLFGLGAIYCVNLPQHRPRNVRLCFVSAPHLF